MKQNKKVPALRFPEFSGEWQFKKLSDLFDIVVGFVGTVSDSYCSELDGIPFIRTLNVKNGWFSHENIQYVSNSFHSKNKKSQIYNDDILIARVGANMGMVCKVKGLKTEANSANVIIIKKELKNNSDFYSFYLSSTKGQQKIKSKGAGGAQEVLNISVAKTILVPTPIIEEQKQISDFLICFDERIEKLTKKKQLLEKYKKGVMQQIFNQEIRFKNDNNEYFPNWEKKKLEDIGIFKSGCGFPESEQNGKEGIPFYKVSDMNLKLNFSEMIEANNYVSLEQINNMKFKVISEYAIIFAKVGAAIFLERKRKAQNFLIDNNMMAFIPKKENIDFIKYFFDTIFLSKYAQVGALPSYNGSDLQKIKICVPSLEEQTKIANFLTEIDKKINLTEKQLNGTKQYKKGLLQQMFI